MKINGWIKNRITAFIVLSCLALSSSALAESDASTSNLEQLEQAVQSLKDSAHETHASAKNWQALESFQDQIWRAMALDPAPGALVPVAQVPKNLFAAELNESLSNQLEELKKSNFPKEIRAQFEFDHYIQIAQQIVDFRKGRQFPQARAIAKRGTLDAAFQTLVKKIEQNSEQEGTIVTQNVTATQVQQFANLVKNLKEEAQTQNKDTAKKDVFTNGTQFIWYAVAAMFGFLMGIAAYRMNPDFFQKFLDQESTAPTATTHTASGAPKLDYARWLKEFEEILSRLKSSQLSHERRIEDVVHNSEKVSQHALALYADARIKNEANLEFRMSTLLREIQHTFEQSQKLQAGDRAHINLMLEHCLKLCDGIESNAIHFDRQKLVEPPHMRTA